jgi:CTP:molybdopterin cytidylyltransferase MocA
MIIFPMAGRSSRFYKAGFTRPKYMLPLGKSYRGVSVFRACVESFKSYFGSETFVFVHLNDEGVREFLEAELKAAGVPEKSCRFVALEDTTSGQAETVAKGIEGSELDVDEQLIIFNIDTIRPGFKLPECVNNKDVAGYIEVVKADGDHWSFVGAAENGRVETVTEKKRISDLCSTGLYYFRSTEAFLKAYRTTQDVDVKSLQGGERYVAPLYNILIAQGQDIRYDLIPMSQVLFSGTPDEYGALLEMTEGPELPKEVALSAKADPVLDYYAYPKSRSGADVDGEALAPWGENENLTVLLHGVYDEGNRAYMSDLIASWRRALPGAQIGFAASEIERNISPQERDFWRQEDLDWIDDRRIRLLRQLRPELDFIVEGRPQNVLAPLKFDDKANNCNKMIASVQAGLAMVKTPWVLRIRSDALIRHPERMAQAYDHFAKHVGTPKVFKRPIAICPYYTINPYGLERMSFHISDWYNLGLTEDVRDYWDVAPMTMADATYFEGVPHAPHTNSFERPMRAKMPPEMMIATTFAARHGYRVPGYFNELGYEADALDFIRENFVMPDPDVIGMSLGKYARERKWILTGLLIISAREWQILAESGKSAFRNATASKRWMLYWANLRRKLNVYSGVRHSKAIRSIGWIIKG